MTPRAALFLCLVGCATAHYAPPDADEDPRADAARPDARVTTTSDAPAAACAAYSGILATWDFTDEVGTQAATPVDVTATGISASSITRSAGLTASTATGAMSSSNWPLSTLRDPTKYYALTITPPTGCALALVAIAIDVKASGTGPGIAALATSTDNFAAMMPLSTEEPSIGVMGIQANGMVELRIYGFAALGSGGTMRLQDMLAISGSIE